MQSAHADKKTSKDEQHIKEPMLYWYQNSVTSLCGEAQWTEITLSYTT